MTIHSAKGLEFDYVFIAGVEEDLFPSKMSLTTQEDLEEERRLFYVALTRAGKQAVVSYATHRYKWGTPTVCSPSRFIKDIDEKYLDRPLEPVIEKQDLFGFDNYNNKPYEKKIRESVSVKQKPTHIIKTEPPLNLNKKLVDMRTASRQQVANPEQFDADDPLKIKPGMVVYHQQFGAGKVVNIEGIIPNAKAVVLFDGAGEKKLLLKFARLKILERNE
jgi:DNA helicase-2/ATP-dependent DNA helicase PcrA